MPSSDTPPPRPGESVPASPDRLVDRGTETPAPPADPAPTPAPAERQAAPETARRPAGIDDKGRVKRTTFGALWAGAIIASLLLILLLIFIVQNNDPVPIRYFGWEGEISLGVAILLAAVVGVLLVAIPGSLRILQLRRALVRNTRS